MLWVHKGQHSGVGDIIVGCDVNGGGKDGWVFNDIPPR